MIQVLLACTTAEHGSCEFKVLHAPLKFERGLCWRGGRQRRESVGGGSAGRKTGPAV